MVLRVREIGRSALTAIKGDEDRARSSIDEESFSACITVSSGRIGSDSAVATESDVRIEVM